MVPAYSWRCPKLISGVCDHVQGHIKGTIALHGAPMDSTAVCAVRSAALAAGMLVGAAGAVVYYRTLRLRPVGGSTIVRDLDRGILDDASTKTLEEMDDYGTIVGAEGASLLTSHNVSKFAVRLAAEARCKFGFDLTFTKANRQMVHEWLYKRLTSTNCRIVVIASVLPKAVALTFLKPKQELELEEELMHPAVRERARVSSTSYWDRWTPTLLERVVGYLIPTLVPAPVPFTN